MSVTVNSNNSIGSNIYHYQITVNRNNEKSTARKRAKKTAERFALLSFGTTIKKIICV